MRFLCAALLFVMLLAPAAAQRVQPSPSPGGTPGTSALPPPRMPIWRCELAAGTYSVAITNIVSVSKHEYSVDNAARVTEVNIDSTGSMVVRFYFLEPNIPTSPLGLGQSTLNKAQEMVNEAVDRTGQSDLWRKVVKNYPTTTHARTIEYRLESRAQLEAIFHSADEAFHTGRGATLKPK